MAYSVVNIDPGTSLTLAVYGDIVGGQFIQAMKLIDGTAGSNTPVGTATNPLNVGIVGTVPVSISGTVPVSIAGTVGVSAAVASPVFVRLSDGTSAIATLPVSIAATVNVGVVGTVPISATALPLPTGAATSAKQPALGTTGAPSADVQTMQGPSLVATAISGAPLRNGMRARSTDIAALTADNVSDVIASLLGKGILLPYALPGQAAQGTTNYTGITAADVIATPGAGIRLYITTLVVSNNSATVSTKVTVRDGTTARIPVSAALGGGGAVIHFPTPWRLAANAALTAICGTTGADVDVSAFGYTAAE